MNLYKTATKENWTFSSQKGQLTVQQLWNLPTESKTVLSLNDIAIGLYNSLTSTTGVSFVSTPSPEDTTINLKLDLVKDIIADKEAEKVAKQTAKANLSHNKMIDQLIEDKKHEKMSEMTIEQLMALKK